MHLLPKLRWLRFSVRTLLVAVTIFCVWLGRQWQIVQGQKAAIQAIRRSGGDCYTAAQTIEMGNGKVLRGPLPWYGPAAIRSIAFGHEPIEFVLLRSNGDWAKVRRELGPLHGNVQEMFPEAVIYAR